MHLTDRRTDGQTELRQQEHPLYYMQSRAKNQCRYSSESDLQQLNYFQLNFEAAHARTANSNAPSRPGPSAIQLAYSNVTRSQGCLFCTTCDIQYIWRRGTKQLIKHCALEFSACHQHVEIVSQTFAVKHLTTHVQRRDLFAGVC